MSFRSKLQPSRPSFQGGRYILGSGKNPSKDSSLHRGLEDMAKRATRGHQASCEKELGPRSCRDPTDRNSALSTRQGIVCLPIPSLQEREIRLAEPQGKLGIPVKRDHKDTIQEMQV
ncbi:hypothetical protein CISG_09776 [Coccidioides immitis RMSCC 3703]|uniref:Uncharacterized protein n=1 Tax=Coccidioides immitis RMSCC 3703 TaxID=454286 RepID=A0A0J8QJJ9_COCIT|nr:hypothetical protein CISG_09776 [Coccidioides immitis RMSCC 3703]